MTRDDALLETRLPFPRRQGKVRDVYDLGDSLLIVATDRISAFDCVMPNGIPGKGKLLTQLSLFWFDFTADLIENHLLARDVADFPAVLKPYAEVLRHRSVVVKNTRVVPIECVARGYLAGSGWSEYRKTGRVCGNLLPAGLRQCDKLPAPIFTPATKADEGHDENIDYDTMVAHVGSELAASLRQLTLSIYAKCADYAAARGVIIADTKFEFGQMPDGLLILIDEILTPDSSRFWPADQYQPGQDQPSFDKQFVRNYLEQSAWDKTPPAPALPPDVIAGTQRRYAEAYEKLTGKTWPSL